MCSAKSGVVASGDKSNDNSLSVAAVTNLTQSQMKMWLGQKLNPEAPLYNMALAFHLTRDVDLCLFRRTFRQLIDETPILRACVEEHAEAPQLRYASTLDIDLDYIDLSRSSDKGISEYLESRAARRFDISKCMIDSVLIATRSSLIWYLNQHHLITDIWSCALLYQRMAGIYRELSQRGQDAGQPLADFRDYVKREIATAESSDYRSSLDYWQGRADIETDSVSTPDVRSLTTSSDRKTLSFGCTRSDNLARLAKAPGIRAMSLQLGELNLFLTILFSYIYRLQGKRNPAVALIFHNRDTAALRRTAGPLIETCPAVVEVQPGETFSSLYKKASVETLGAMRNLKPGISACTVNRTYDVVLNFITAEFPDFCGMPTRVEWIHSGHADANHLLRVQVYNLSKTNAFDLSFDINKGAYARPERDRIVDHFMKIADRMLGDFDSRIDGFDLLSESERNAQVVAFNKTRQIMPPESTVVELYEAQVNKTPLARAVRCGHRSLSYGEINEFVNRLAHGLIERNIGARHLVGVEAKRSLETLIAIFAILKSGAAYVPLDPALPAGRLQQYLQSMRECQADGSAIVLTQTEAAQRVFERLGAETFDSSTLLENLQDGALDNPPLRADCQDLAYVLFTSGSTGQPKGVMVDHGNLANYLCWARGEYGADGALTFALFTSLSFDLTITSLFVPLISGHDVVVYPDKGGRSDLALLDVLAEDAVDIIKLTPSHLALMLPGSYIPRRLSKLIVGGEDLYADLARQIHLLLDGRVSIYNEYGPTEATVGAMIHRFEVDEDVNGTVSIGRPVANTQIYVLDSYGNPVPTNAVGEICIGGAGVARGYLNDPALTAERFIAHPFIDRCRMYRTGDLAKWDDKGSMRLIGRMDRQIKVRGYRVELGEIESILSLHPAVRQCAVEQTKDSPEHESVALITYCDRCGLPSNYPNVEFDSDGLCSICSTFGQKRSLVENYFDTAEDLEHLAARIAGERVGEYGCIALFSGGKDSTYMLCKLVELGVKPLAFTLDNGFISDGAKANIARVVEHLEVDHIFGRTDHMNEIFADSLERHSNVCNGCFKTIYTLSTELALSKNIRFIITGLSRGQLFETRLVDMVEDEIYDARKIDDYIQDARKAYHRMSDAVSTCLDVDLFKTDDVFEKVEFVDFFRYCDVTLTDIFDYLATRVPWIRPSDTGRSTNCLINDVGIFVHKKERGYHNYALPYSWDVRLGHKRRDDALTELDDEIDTKRVEDILSTLNYHTKEPALQPKSRIIAFCATDMTDYAELDAYMGERLPSYMKPDGYILLKVLPLSPHGKVDRRQLRAAVGTEYHARRELAEPTTPVESRLCSMWQELLGIGEVGTTESFFDLGGDSLLIVRAVAQIQREFDVRIELAEFFEKPTIIALGRRIDEILLQEVMSLEASSYVQE